MERKLDVLKRMYILVFVFLVVAVVLFSRVVNISVIEGDHWRSERDSLYLKYVPIEAKRGNILSDDGSFLATSLQFFDIRVDLNSTGMRPGVFEENVDSLAICLSKYVDQSKSSTWYKNYLIKKKNSGSRYAFIKNNATYRDVEQMKTFPLLRLGRTRGGFIVEPKVIRKKPFKHLANRTIGEFRDNAQQVGLESYFDNDLRGNEGKQLRYRVAQNVWLPVNDLTEITPTKGSDIQTTINVGIQDVAHSALLKSLEHHKAEYGVAIVMEVATGAVKAIVNLKQTQGGGYAEMYNDAVGTRIEPGSTFKLATMMALMEDDRLDLDERVVLDGGQMKFCRRWMHDSERHNIEETTARHAFEISSNVGMARLVTDKYKARSEEEKFVEKIRQFRLDKKTGVEIKGEAKPFLREAYDLKNGWSCTSLPWMSFGYEIMMTPLQMLAFYNAVANDGKYMKPYLVSGILENRELVEKFEPVVLDEQIASPSTIENAHKLLKGVMLNGTGKKIKLPFSTAGKTGTSQINYADANRSKTRYQSSFAGFFPADNPQYSCIVIVNDPRENGYYGSKVAGPVFREIALKCMNRIPEHIELAEDAKVTHPLWNVGYREDVKTVLDSMDTDYAEWTDSEFVVLTESEEKLQMKSRRVTDKEVPNVINMTMRDALYVLENLGYTTDVSGKGRVVAQSLKPGATTDLRDIKLTLK